MLTIVSQNTPVEDREKELLTMLKRWPKKIIIVCPSWINIWTISYDLDVDGGYIHKDYGSTTKMDRSETLKCLLMRINKFNEIVIVPIRRHRNG